MVRHVASQYISQAKLELLTAGHHSINQHCPEIAGDFDFEATLTVAEVIVTDKQYTLEILGTTGAGDAITVMGAKEYGELCQQVKDVKSTMNNGICEKVDTLSTCMAKMRGGFTTYKKMVDETFKGK